MKYKVIFKGDDVQERPIHQNIEKKGTPSKV